MTEPVSRDRKQSVSKLRSHQLNDRLLVEAVADLEQIEGRIIGERAAIDAAVQAGRDFESRLVERARTLSIANGLSAALRDVRHAIAIVIFAGIVLALVAGAAAAKTALTSFGDKPVNFFWAIAVLLGVQSLMLLVWLVLLIGGSRLKPGPISIASLGGLLVRAARFVFAKTHRTPLHAAASSAVASVSLHGPIAKWTLSSISHGLWLAFNIGCLAILILLLSAKQYSFAWETTILSDRYFEPLTKAVAALPHALGFVVPNESQIEQSQWSSAREFTQSSETRQAWSSLLVASVVVYGFAPRLLLLGYALGRRRTAMSRYRIDVARPEFARLEPMLMPAQRLGIIDHDDAVESRTVRSLVEPVGDHRPVGPPAILGLELAEHKGATAWPPPLHAVRWLDLGFVESGDDQRRVISQLQTSPQSPQAVVIVSALITTPDRGIAAFIEKIQQSMSHPVCLVLTGGQTMRDRGDAARLEQRVADWHELARRVGVEQNRFAEIDLDHFTQASSAKLAALIEPNGALAKPPSTRRIEQAFELIADFTGRTRDDRERQAHSAKLHQAISRLYANETERWSVFGGRDIPWDRISPTQLTSTLANGASSVLDRLPARLRLKPRWLAAGAAAGALGCVAAATFVAPVAISALPIWSAVGAAVSAALSTINPHQKNRDANSSVEPEDLQHIRSAALLAIILELQGRNEPSITRIIDQTIGDDHDLTTAQHDEVAAWLNHLRHRFDMAIARETAA